MSRNSEIDRASLGGRVLGLAAEGDSASTIAKSVSEESGKDISVYMVHRHIQKNALNAAATFVPPEGEHSALEMLAAAIAGAPDKRDTETTTYYGAYKIDSKNIFDQYYGIARGIRNGQVLRAFKNIALKITTGAAIIGDDNDADKIDALTRAINFSTLLQDVVRSTCEMGTCVVLLKSVEGAYTLPQVTPMNYLTLLTDKQTPGTVDESLVHGSVTKIVHNEGGDNQLVYERDDVGLFRIWSSGHILRDIMGRSTYSVYGESMTIGVENPLKSILNSSYYYDEFIKRYGMGRLHINMKLLSEMIKDQTITPAAAQTTQDKDTAALQKIGPNEDIISTGREISMIESKTGFDIIPYLTWRETQINRALLQSDVGSGDVGSSWTSAGTAVSAQELTALQSLRETFFNTFFDEIILPRLPEFGLDPTTLSLTAEPLSQAPVPYQVMTDWVDRGIISDSEARVRGGFTKTKPEEI